MGEMLQGRLMAMLNYYLPIFYYERLMSLFDVYLLKTGQVFFDTYFTAQSMDQVPDCAERNSLIAAVTAAGSSTVHRCPVPGITTSLVPGRFLGR